MTILTDSELREVFEAKMQMVADKTGAHPKMLYLMSSGPEFAEQMYEQTFAIFRSGYALAMGEE